MHTEAREEVGQHNAHPNLIFFIRMWEAVNSFLAREIGIETEIPEKAKHGADAMFCIVGICILPAVLCNTRKDYRHQGRDKISGGGGS
jgi:hypothetical protein